MTAVAAGEATARAGEPQPAARPATALPQLAGVWRKAFLTLWFMMLPLAIVAPLAGTYIYFKNRAAPIWESVGVGISVEQGRRIEDLISAEARASGLRRGDMIIAIDGREVTEADTETVEMLLDRPEGARVVLTVRSGREGVRHVPLTRQDPYDAELLEGSGVSRRMMDITRIFPSLIASLALVAAAILLFRRKRETIPLILSLSLLLVSGYLSAASEFWKAYEGASLAGWLGSTGWCGMLLVLLAFPSGRFEPMWTLVPALFLPLWWVFSAFDMLGYHVEVWGLMTLMATGVVALASRYRRLPPGEERQQLRWVFLGFAIGTTLLAAMFSIAAGMNALMALDPRWWSWAAMIIGPLGALGLVSYAAGLIVSILRYRLYDADQVISRSAGYAVLTVFLAATFAAAAKGIEIFFESYFGREAGALPGALAAGFAVVLVTPFNNRIQGWAERRFQKALLRLRRDLPECVGDMRETSRLTELLDEVLGRLATGVRASRAAVLIRGELAAVRDVPNGEARAWLGERTPNAAVEALDCERSDPLFPMRVPLRVRHGVAEPVGWILLGPRPDGSFYGKDEQEALAEIVDPVARAVQIVLLREEREEENRAWRGRQEERFAALEAAVARLATAPASPGRAKRQAC